MKALNDSEAWIARGSKGCWKQEGQAGEHECSVPAGTAEKQKGDEV